MYICTNCGKRGNTSDIQVMYVKNDDEIRKKQLENMERKVREHNIKESKIIKSTDRNSHVQGVIIITTNKQ